MLHSALAFFTLAVAAVLLALVLQFLQNNSAHAAPSRLVQGSVRITPSPILREAAAGHPVYYLMTVANLGEEADTFNVSISGNVWPVTVLAADTNTKVTSTSELAAGGQFALVVQIDVPNDAARGVRDTVRVHAISASDANVRDAAFLATTSLGPAADLPFMENFPANTLDAVRWLSNFGPAIVNTDAANEPSPAFAVNFDGADFGGDLISSQPINLSRKRDVVLQFAYERGGNGNSPEPGDDFFVEYHNVDGEWLRLLTLPGAGVDMLNFATESALLPRDAYHSSFRVRFGNIATQGPFDDWYLDDVRVLEITPGKIPFADDFPTAGLDPDKWPQASGVLVNNVALNIPSPPFAVNLQGGAELQSRPLDLSAENAVSLTYQFEQTGGGEEPDPGDDLVIEYRDALNNWRELARHLGSEGGLPVFTRKEIVLPPPAYHRDFRVRFRNLGAQGRDDWFVDDVVLDVFAPSDIDVSPTAISLKLFEEDEATRNVTINNLGVGDLFYRLRIVPPEFGAAPASLPNYPVAYYAAAFVKGETDWRRGREVTFGRGGPDNFGYIWRDSEDPRGPAFQWEDISAGGARIADLGDDDNVGFFNIGFAFPFYDSVFTQFRVCSNGFISFTSAANFFSNNPIPSIGSVADLIAPFWDDLDARPGAVYYHSTGQRLIVQWQNVVRAGSNEVFTFQLILFASGNIRFQYLQIGAPNNFATVGIQNHDGSDGVEVAFNTTFVKNNLAVQIERPASWLSYSPKVGSLTSGGTLDLAVHFSARDLRPDSTYRAELRIESNDLDEPSVPVQLTLEVLALDDSTRHFPGPETTNVKYPIVIDAATIDGEALASGDEIGVFTASGKIAGGLVWRRGQAGRMIAYGDDPNTPPIEGFLPGEPMYFRIWDSSRNDRDYPASATYIRGDGRFGTADSAHIAVLEANTTFARQKTLQANWSWISFNVRPASTDIAELLADTKQLRIMKDGAGRAFIPNLLNTIQNLDPLAGYSVYLDAADSIAITGEEVPPFTPMPLQPGWNFISFLPVNRILAPLALLSLRDQLVIAKNDAGGFYIPSLGNVNTLGDMQPGEGYKVYLSAADTLVYPLGGLPSAQPKIVAAMRVTSNLATQHFKAPQRGSDNYIVIVQGAKVQGASLRAGDEIGIFTHEGELVGAGVWSEGGALGLAAWRAEISNDEARGFVPGAQMRFKAWRQSDQSEVELFGKFQRGDGTFANDAFALVELVDAALPETFALEQNYPNPLAAGKNNFATTIRYALPEPSRVTIRVYDVLGQLVRTLHDGAQEAGFHRLHWDGRNAAGKQAAAGIYFYRMQAGKFEAVKKILVLR
jgi:hypothetical protein